jgi:hypothetical protein
VGTPTDKESIYKEDEKISIVVRSSLLFYLRFRLVGTPTDKESIYKEDEKISIVVRSSLLL